MRRAKLFIPLGIFVVLVIFFWRGLSLDPSDMPSALVGKPFPEFQLNSLLENKPLTRQDLLGDVALVNVWASWCAACKYEHPIFHSLSEKGVRIVGISYKDKDEAAKRWLQELGNPYQFNITDRQGTLAIDLGVFGAPETYLIDKQGIIRYKQVGIVDMKVWDEQLKPLYDQYSQ
ncbi:thiol:disulfide interchange protein [Candidatus Endobugula sertula]|uniref:Thiol:disulfide interchange protein n=1 Tax=Candidatus Endobugula sertula TaxID=62101 RepID=A0A1D2QT59_9GAMM|nr:thiol:disulfide interchange protein [Candidatus Endobugula sertula]